MKKNQRKKLHKLNNVTHRDLGYFFSGLIVIYCLSGLALNHVNDWNPDFIIEKEEISVPSNFPYQDPQPKDISMLATLVGEDSYKVYDKPTSNQVKVYFEDASLHINQSTHTGIYEKVSRRQVFYQANVLHRNSLKGWKWVSDIFAVLLILISITGLFIRKGKNGLRGRGKWFVSAGLLLPIVAWILFGLK